MDTGWRSFLLGAVCGLVVGVVGMAYIVQPVYAERDALRESMNAVEIHLDIGDRLEAVWKVSE